MYTVLNVFECFTLEYLSDTSGSSLLMKSIHNSFPVGEMHSPDCKKKLFLLFQSSSEMFVAEMQIFASAFIFHRHANSTS